MQKPSFVIEANQQLIMARPIGAWGESTARRFVEEINQHVESSMGNIVGFIDLRQWELGTPEALAIIGKNIFHAAALGYRLEVHYGSPKAIPVQVSKERLTPDTLTLLQTLDIEEAIEIINSYGFDFDRAELLAFISRI